ncbi:MAG: hypothetical protein ACI9OJ_001016, partial [Myxococcota bacterium]
CDADAKCFDGDPCTLDRCNASTNQCFWVTKDCVDGVACTVDHRCGNGGCEFLADPACSAECESQSDCAVDDPCFSGSCVAGACQLSAVPCDGAACSHDADCGLTPCSVSRCIENACVVEGVGCDDSNPCTADSCGPQGCEFALEPQCSLGCEADEDCDDDDSNTIDSCDVAANQCANLYSPPCASDADCYDDDACSFERCGAGGRCESSLVVCFDGNACTKDLAPCGGALNDLATEIAYESCDVASGQQPACDPAIGCFHLPVLECGEQLIDGKVVNVECAEDADCATGHLCYPGTCDGGICHTSSVSCPDPGPNKQAFCDWQTGQCSTVDFPGWNGCSAHKDCRYLDDYPDLDPVLHDALRDGYDRCSIGFCNLGAAAPQCMFFEKKCNDLNPCTADTCDLEVGCQFVAIENCAGCTVDAECSDLDPCTLDSCEPTGECHNESIIGCTACTINTAGQRCNDGNDCTRDECDMIETGRLSNEAGNCVNPPYTGAEKPWCFSACLKDTDCVDGNPCTLNRCDGASGQCTFDQVTCVTDLPCANNLTCDPEAAGCQQDISGSCIGKACSTDADCAGGSPCLYLACESNTCALKITECNDNNPNTFDYCDPFSGDCIVVGDSSNPDVCASPADCDDGTVCTTDDCLEFNGTFCQHGPIVCTDFNACTTDTCDPITGCQFAPIIDCLGCTTDTDCADGNSCSADRCTAGQCTNPTYPAVGEPTPSYCP